MIYPRLCLIMSPMSASLGSPIDTTRQSIVNLLFQINRVESNLNELITRMNMDNSSPSDKAGDTHQSTVISASEAETSAADFNVLSRSLLSDLTSKVTYLLSTSEIIDNEKVKESIEKEVEDINKKKYEIIRSLRVANVNVSRCINQKKIREKSLLYDGKEGILKQQRAVTQANVAQKSSEITDGLRRLNRIVNQELERSSGTLALLSDSSRKIHDTHQQHKQYSETVGEAKNVLSKLRKRDRTDQVLMIIGLLFFIVVVAYIVRKRLGGIVGWGI